MAIVKVQSAYAIDPPPQDTTRIGGTEPPAPATRRAQVAATGEEISIQYICPIDEAPRLDDELEVTITPKTQFEKASLPLVSAEQRDRM